MRGTQTCHEKAPHGSGGALVLEPGFCKGTRPRLFVGAEQAVKDREGSGEVLSGPRSFPRVVKEMRAIVHQHRSQRAKIDWCTGMRQPALDGTKGEDQQNRVEGEADEQTDGDESGRGGS